MRIMGQLQNRASRMMMLKVNARWTIILHYSIGSVSYTKEDLAKSRGRREELGRRRNRINGDRMPHRASCPDMCKISY